MKRWISGVLATVFTFSLTSSVLADSSWVPRWLGGKSDEVSHTASSPRKTTRPTSAASKTKSSNLFTNTKNLFTPKSKSRVISQWPNNKANTSRPKSRTEDKPSWFSSLFKPSEPEPPQSINDWMKLKQIKP